MPTSADPYQPPAMEDGAGRRQLALPGTAIAWLLASVHLLVVAGGTVVLIIVVPKFEVIFKDLGIQLPVMTELLIDSHRSGALVVAALALMAPAMVVQFVAPRSGWRVLLPLLLLLASLVLAALMVVGLFLPLVTVIEALGQQQ